MAQMMTLSLLSLVLALCIPWTQGSDGGGQDCCLKYSQKKIPYSIVRGYRKQEPSLGCPIPAILFLPRKHSKPELCANPEEGWVQNLMRRLDQPPAPGKQSPGCRKNREPLSLERKERAPRAARELNRHSPQEDSPVARLEPRRSPTNFKLGGSRSNSQAKRELENRLRSPKQPPHAGLRPHPCPASTITSARPSLSYLAELPSLG